MKWMLPLLAISLVAQEQNLGVDGEPLPQATKSNWTFHKHFGLGYRYDNQNFEQIALQESIKIAPRQTIELISCAELLWKNVYLRSKMSYGWLVSGDLMFKTFGTSLPQFSLGSGYTADAAAQIGWRFHFIQSERFGFYFIPSGGYKYSHLMGSPNGSQKSSLDPSTILIGRFSHSNQQDWFGPYLDLRFKFRFKDVFEADFYYEYARPSLRSVFQYELDRYVFNNSGLVLADLNRTHSVVHGNALRAQIGGFELKYQTSEGWTFSLHGEGSACWSDTSRTLGKSVVDQYSASSIAKSETKINVNTRVHWIQAKGSLFLGYRF